MALYLKYWLTVVVLHAIAIGKLAVFVVFSYYDVGKFGLVLAAILL